MRSAIGLRMKCKWAVWLVPISVTCLAPPTVTDEMNTSLNKPFVAKEVQRDLNQMAPLTTPGPDGMSPIFYKSFWHIVGKDVVEVVLSALNSGVIPESLNSTFIALIPKIKDPKKFLISDLLVFVV